MTLEAVEKPVQGPREFSAIDMGQLQAVASGEGALEQAEQQRAPVPVPAAAGGDQDDLGLSPTTAKFTYLISEVPLKFGKFEIKVKVEAEVVKVVSSGITTGERKPKTPTTSILGNESKLETKGKNLSENLKLSFKTTIVGTKLVVFGKPVELKFFEAAVDSEQLGKVKGRQDFMDILPKVDLIKAQTYFSLATVPQFAPLVKPFTDAGCDVRIKVELSLPLSSVLPEADLDELKRIADKLDDVAKRVADWEKTTGKLLDQSDDLAEKLKSSGLRKGRFHKDPALKAAKQTLRALANELDDIAANPKVVTPLLRSMASRMARNGAGKLIARVAIKAMTKLTRLIPVVGWVLFAVDVLELAWLGYNIATGRAKFLGGGDSISLADDIWNAFGEAPPEPDPDGVPRSKDDPSEQSKLAKADQAALRDTGSPVGRLVKGIAMVLPDGEGKLKQEHFERLLRIATQRQLTAAQVDEILAKIAQSAPPSTADAVLDMIEKILDDVVKKTATIDTDGDGVPDAADTDGDGKVDAVDTDGDGKVDAVDKDGDGKARTPRKGNGDGTKTKRKQTGGTTESELPALSAIVDDPLGAGMFTMQMTSGGVSDPTPATVTIATRGGVVRCTAARWREGRRPRVVGSDQDMYMEVRVELAIASQRANGTIQTKVVTRDFEYSWIAKTGRFVRMREVPNAINAAVVVALKQKLASGQTENLTFRIIEKKKIPGGFNVQIEIMSVKAGVIIVRDVDGRPKEYEVGQTEWHVVTDAEISAKK